MKTYNALKSANNSNGGGKMTVRNFISEYKIEVVLGIVLSVCVALGHWLLGYAPSRILNNYIDLLLNGGILVVSLFGGVMLWRHHNNVRARKIFSLSLFGWALVAVAIMVYMIYTDERGVSNEQAVQDWMMGAGDFLAWLLLIYPAEVLRPRWVNWKRAFLRLLPVPFLMVLDYFSPVDLSVLFLLYVVYLIYALSRHLHAYHKWCEDNYSSLEDIDEHWILQYLVMVSVTGLSYIIIVFSNTPAHMVTQRTLLLFLLAYSTEQVLFRPDPWCLVRSNKQVGGLEEEEETDSPVPELPSAVYRETLEKWMQEEKPYLNPEFRLLDMRQVLPLNRTYLSRLINDEYGCSFYQFVTNYRIEEAKRLMREHPDMKMQDVAEQSGFSSPTVFGRIFARETGLTPREWNTKNDNS